MADGSDAQRPHDNESEPAPDDQAQSQEELDRVSRDTGGDADAAGSIEEREAVAKDDDDAFGGGSGAS